MLNFCSLFSSSDGNCLFIESDNTKILIDAGVSIKKIELALDNLNVNLKDIDAILVTHEHSDHVKSLGAISKKYDIPVYANEKTWSVLDIQKSKIEKCNQKVFDVYNDFLIGNLKIFPFSIPHDAVSPCGFNISYEKKKISIVTDLGHITPEILTFLKNSSFIMLESNYDPEVLKYCSYPSILKRRISGPTGHLSNNNAGELISELIDSGLKQVVLGHMSKESNFPDLAYKTIVEQLHLHNYDETTISLNFAERLSPSKLIKIS